MAVDYAVTARQVLSNYRKANPDTAKIGKAVTLAIWMARFIIQGGASLGSAQKYLVRSLQASL